MSYIGYEREEKMSGKSVAKTGSLEALKRIKTPYAREVREFIDYLEDHGHGLSREGIESYMIDLKQRNRLNGKSKAVTYSASWHNQRIKAVKRAVREALDRSPELNNGQRYGIEKYLQSMKLRKVKAGIGKAERIPTGEEIKVLIEAADLRLGLMIEFLAETGARITEVLNSEIGNARRGVRITYIKIKGKGEKERDLRCRTGLYDRIREEFQGERWIFEHNGKQYSRISTTNRIKILAEKTISKPVTAHMIRHYRGTVLSEKLGISKAASELGHASINTTKRFYDHTSVSDEEFLESLENEK